MSVPECINNQLNDLWLVEHFCRLSYHKWYVCAFMAKPMLHYIVWEVNKFLEFNATCILLVSDDTWKSSDHCGKQRIPGSLVCYYTYLHIGSGAFWRRLPSVSQEKCGYSLITIILAMEYITSLVMWEEPMALKLRLNDSSIIIGSCVIDHQTAPSIIHGCIPVVNKEFKLW